MIRAFAALALMLGARDLWSQDVSTLSFTERPGGTYSATIQGRETIEVDLSALAPHVVIYRAILHPGRDEADAFSHRNEEPRITAAATGEALLLVPPRFHSFDATAAVKRAREKGSPTVSFTFEHFPGYRPLETRLDVTCSAKSKNEIPAVTGLVARHRDGQTLLTWNEPRPEAPDENLTIGGWRRLVEVQATRLRSLRYRIYRSSAPFDMSTVSQAELIDEIAPLSCWNPDFYGISPRDSDRVPRYVVESGQGPVRPGTGIYAHHPKAPGKAYYLVSLAVNGEENLTTFSAGNTTEAGVLETVGPGAPVLQRTVLSPSFNYVDRPTLSYYVRWEAPPRANLPSRPYDYLVALPAKRPEAAPVGLHLHCWGANLEGGYGWWYNAAQGAILISTNQIPYDWWTGYHEYSGTWKSWKGGVVRDYTQARLLAFLDWAGTTWKIDRTRVFTAGSSMGGSGSPNLALRRSDQVAWAVSWVGVHSPARSPQFRGSYERVYGPLDWKISYQDGETPAFDYFDDEKFLRRDPARDVPLLCFSNGKNDGAIGWPQARDFWRALQETRRPHVFVWGQSGHGQRALLPGARPDERELGIDVRVDRTLPAFTRCSLDQDPGDGDPKNGDLEGQSNLYLSWDSGDGSMLDEAGRWSLVLRLGAGAPASACTVDVTPRRCQAFKPGRGARAAWTNFSLADSKDIQKGEVAADPWGLLTVPGVTVSSGGNRLTLRVIP
jgi:S-formylglutathione hydrolase FrmB